MFKPIQISSFFNEENLEVYKNLPIDSLPEVMPKISITYRAQWNTIKSKVKFVIPPNKEYLIYDNVGTPIDMEEINKTVGSRLGYTFNGWDITIPEKVPEFNTIITGSWIPDIQYEINNSNNNTNCSRNTHWIFTN